jgi:diguanylate cyclase (GGDEF)-like protein
MTSFANTDRKPGFKNDSTYTDYLPPEFHLVQQMMDASFRLHDQLEMLKCCTRGLVSLFKAKGAAIWVREDQDLWLLVIASPGPLNPEAAQEVQSVSQEAYRNLSGRIVSAADTTLYVDAKDGTASPSSPAFNWTVFPIQTEQELMGVLLLDLPPRFSEAPERMARLYFLMDHLQTSLLAIQNVRELLVTDPLTGCYNRWFMDVELAKICESGDPHPEPFAVILLDVDHFKSINDLYGHNAGDRCLIDLAEILRQNVRMTDDLIRMGGDEFLLILPEIEKKDLVCLADRILTVVQTDLKLHAAPQEGVTLSMGVVMHESTGGSLSEEGLLERVDQALYRSKRNGRNQVTFWSPELEAGDEPEVAASGGEGVFLQEMQARINQLELELSDKETQLVETLNLILTTKEFETGLHSLRVTRITKYLLDKLEIPDIEQQPILWGAELHDIGKIAIPEAILHKQSGLSDSEWMIIRQHPLIGHRFVAGYPFLARAADVILHHHEAYDGNGYPHGLKGEDIPFGARLFTLVDAYDSMRANRIYKSFTPMSEAIGELERKSGSQFAPQLVKVFLEHSGEIEKIGNWQS